jgi:hypothetical protein
MERPSAIFFRHVLQSAHGPSMDARVKNPFKPLFFLAFSGISSVFRDSAFRGG